MNYSKYTKKISPPIKKDFEESRTLITKYGNEITVLIFDEEEYNNQVKKYQLEYNDIISRFKYDLAEEFNILNNVRCHDLINIAWECGQHRGFQEVYRIAACLLPLIK